MLTLEALETLGRCRRRALLAQAECARLVSPQPPRPGARTLAARAARELGALFYTLGDALAEGTHASR